MNQPSTELCSDSIVTGVLPSKGKYSSKSQAPRAGIRRHSQPLEMTWSKGFATPICCFFAVPSSADRRQACCQVMDRLLLFFSSGRRRSIATSLPIGIRASEARNSCTSTAGHRRNHSATSPLWGKAVGAYDHRPRQRWQPARYIFQYFLRPMTIWDRGDKNTISAALKPMNLGQY